MSAWIIEPREPLIARDGRPFDPQPGVIAETLPFFFPSTTAGAARSRAGSENGVFVAQDDASIAKLRGMQVRGPLLEKQESEGEWTLLTPAPADALLLKDGGEVLLRCKQLVPLLPFVGASMSFPLNEDGQRLFLVGQEEYEAEKAPKNLPAFWYWSRFEQWLLKPEAINKELSREGLGLLPLLRQQQMHVALERGMMVAREGALFETHGLEFTAPPFASEQAHLSQAGRLALWLDVEDQERKIGAGLDSLGGERRLVKWQPSTVSLKSFDDLRKQISEQIALSHACRLILLTPAYFQKGYLPNMRSGRWEHGGVKPQLRAILTQRPQVVSGWDLAQGGIKPTRRLTPAGSVLFLEFPEELDEDAIDAWTKQIWMNCVSDEKQDCLDGFGLAILGTWDGKPREMRLKEDKE